MTESEWFEQLFNRLSHSKFRSSFHLKQKDKEYIRAAKSSRRASKRNDNRAAAGNIVVKTWCLHGKTKEIQW